MNIEEDGKEVRKFYNLSLEMSKINMLALSWTVVHPIDKNSPLFEIDKETLDKSKAEFMVLMNGINNTLSQNVHSRTSYKHYDVEWGAKFSPIFKYHKGKAVIAVDKIGSFEKVNSL